MYKYYIVALLIILIIIALILKYIINTNDIRIEHVDGTVGSNKTLTPEEAIQNVASMINTGTLTVSNLKVTNSSNILPIGSIIMWYGDQDPKAIPDGWAYCDGSTVNGHKVPDLRGRFILSAESNYKKKTQLKPGPGAINLGPTSNAGNHSHSVTNCIWGYAAIGKRSDHCTKIARTNTTGLHTHNITKGNLTLGNMYPIFHRLIFIMRIR